jgi:Flp pilus assembly protein TadG
MAFHSFRQIVKRLQESRRGVVVIETGFAAPILLVALAGVTDLSMMALTRFKLSSGANNIGTIVSGGGRALDEAEMTDALDNIEKIVSPIDDFETNGKLIIAAVESTDEVAGRTKVVWNRCTGGLSMSGMTANEQALAGPDGGIYTLASAVSLDPGLTSAVVQMSYKFKPMFLGAIMPSAGTVITKTYVQRTRYGEFTTTVINQDQNTTADDVPIRHC